ncbi:intraflagellar transport protein 25 homolog isoform X2 [Mirounga angustirostris]|uniref:intraflagellar transport protein 25 homolog isoform X2 n=1 Tax=Mirounga angustirostris TaxID=9716 RepID=UPI00313E2354
MRKTDLCLSSEGTEVILATSSDEKHPPENIIDGNPETFWTTTGMFPQEFIICFHKHVRIERLVIQSYFDLVHTEGQLQNEEIRVFRWLPIILRRNPKLLSDLACLCRVPPASVPAGWVKHLGFLDPQPPSCFSLPPSSSRGCLHPQCEHRTFSLLRLQPLPLTLALRTASQQVSS